MKKERAEVIMERALPIKIELPRDFLCEEERCGYVVSTKMKKVWAIEIDLLKELERVCKKYSINYYADSGTLIGAVRHKGFIPWDDDIDVVMFREDYERLKEIAGREFKEPYFFQTTYSDKLYIRGHAQLRNSETTGFIPDDEKRPFNKGIFLDIFVMDIIPDDETERANFIRRVKKKWKIVSYGNFPYDRKHGLKGKVFGYIIKNSYYRIIDYKDEFMKYEELCSKYNNTNNHTISYVAYSKGKDKHMFRKEWYEFSEEVPFEFTTIVIPSGYDQRLIKEYNDYMTIKNVPATHSINGAVIFEPEIPYMRYFEIDAKDNR